MLIAARYQPTIVPLYSKRTFYEMLLTNPISTERVGCSSPTLYCNPISHTSFQLVFITLFNLPVK